MCQTGGMDILYMTVQWNGPDLPDLIGREIRHSLRDTGLAWEKCCRSVAPLLLILLHLKGLAINDVAGVAPFSRLYMHSMLFPLQRFDCFRRMRREVATKRREVLPRKGSRWGGAIRREYHGVVEGFCLSRTFTLRFGKSHGSLETCSPMLSSRIRQPQSKNKLII